MTQQVQSHSTVDISVKTIPAASIQSPPRGQPKTVSVTTFGCKVNTFESETIGSRLAAMGLCRQDGGKADLHIINTCTVTAEADRQARQRVRKIVRENPQAWIVVTGCYAQMAAETCKDIPGVDLVVGNSEKLRIPELLAAMYRGDAGKVILKSVDEAMSMPDGLLSGYEAQSRAFVQVQQGCDQGCTFCIIHKARGRNRSFSANLIVRQVERLVMNGYREIVLCGVDLGSYGDDFHLSDAKMNLVGLLERLLQLPGEFRLRLSSIDPFHITPSLAALMADSTRVCPHLHLSLQSGNTLILKRMKRRATREIVYDRVALLRRHIPNLLLSADILVGFPTEDSGHFAQTLAAIDELEIAYSHVFGYSRREGTPAARIPAQVAQSEIKSRVARARAQGRSVWQRVAARQVGRVDTVLVEGSGEFSSRGRLGNYFPVALRQRSPTGRLVPVRVVGVKEQTLIAEQINAGKQ